MRLFKLLFLVFFLLSCQENSSEEDKWIYGIWEARTNLNHVKVQLFSNKECKLFVTAYGSEWMSGEYKINDSSIELIINKVPIMFSIDKNKRRIFTANGTEMAKSN